MSVAVPGKRGENLVIPKDADFKPTAFFAEGSRKVSKKDVSYSFFDRPPKNWWEQTFVIDVGVNIRPDADTKKDKASQILPVILLQEGPAFRKAAEFSDRLYTAVPRVVFEECIRLGQPIPPDAILFIPIKQLRSTDPDDYARALDNEAALKSELKNVTEMTKKFHKPEYLQVFNSPWNAFREKSKLPKDPNWFVALYRGFCGWARRRLGGE